MLQVTAELIIEVRKWAFENAKCYKSEPLQTRIADAKLLSAFILSDETRCNGISVSLSVNDEFFVRRVDSESAA